MSLRKLCCSMHRRPCHKHSFRCSLCVHSWEIIVHSLKRIDLHGLVGQTSHASILFTPDSKASQGLAQAFSSAPSELRVSPDAPFALQPASAQELRVALRPIEPGRKQYVIHLVELRSYTLLASYLVAAVARLPSVTKSFSLAVPASLGANRKVSLANPYSYNMNFLIHTGTQDHQRCHIQICEPHLSSDARARTPPWIPSVSTKLADHLAFPLLSTRQTPHTSSASRATSSLSLQERRATLGSNSLRTTQHCPRTQRCACLSIMTTTKMRNAWKSRLCILLMASSLWIRQTPYELKMRKPYNMWFDVRCEE